MGDQPAVNERWQGKWDRDEIRWHMDYVNANLQKFMPDLIKEGARVFVPLCGKTLDMKWFYDKGCTVVGVEAVEKAVVEYFAEQQIEYETTNIEGFQVYTSKDSRMQIFKGNLFNFNEIIASGKFDHFWDKSSLVAIDKDTREKYVDLFSRVMKSGCTGLLEVFEYDTSFHSEQPFPIFLEDMNTMYSDLFTYKEISRLEDTTWAYPRSTVAYTVTRK